MGRPVGRIGFSPQPKRPTAPAAAIVRASAFWDQRKNLNYFQTSREAVHFHFPGLTSILDLGGGNSRFLCWFPTTRLRVAADIKQSSNLYTDEPAIDYIVTDGTLDQFDGGEFDIVTAFQTIEHCALSGDEILHIARRGIVVSYPYKWNKPQSPRHHNLDETWFKARMGRDPDHEYIVSDLGMRRNVTVFLK